MAVPLAAQNRDREGVTMTLRAAKSDESRAEARPTGISKRGMTFNVADKRFRLHGNNPLELVPSYISSGRLSRVFAKVEMTLDPAGVAARATSINRLMRI